MTYKPKYHRFLTMAKLHAAFLGGCKFVVCLIAREVVEPLPTEMSAVVIFYDFLFAMKNTTSPLYSGFPGGL